MLTTALDSVTARAKEKRLVLVLDEFPYRPEFPARFGSLEDARAFCQRFLGRGLPDRHPA